MNTHLGHRFPDGQLHRQGALLEDAFLDVAGVEAVVGDFAGVQFVEERSQCEDVHGFVVGALLEEFLGHVDGRA